VAEVVGEGERFGQILVEPERASDGSADLGDFDAVGQADAEMIAVGGNKDLRFVPQTAEADRVDDAITVALEDVPRAGAIAKLRTGPAARSLWVRGEGLGQFHSVLSFLIVWPGGLVQLNASTRTLSRSSMIIFASETLLNGPINSRVRSGASAT